VNDYNAVPTAILLALIDVRGISESALQMAFIITLTSY